MRKMLLVTFPISIGVLLLDQLSKFWALEKLSDQSIELIPGLFSLTLAFNKGAAFGMLSRLPEGTRQLALAGATLFALGVVLVMLLKQFRNNPLGWASCGLIIGGALGNIVDRVRLGMVVDFLDVFWNQYHWPTFNVADSFICIGVGVLLFLKSDVAGA